MRKFLAVWFALAAIIAMAPSTAVRAETDPYVVEAWGPYALLAEGVWWRSATGYYQYYQWHTYGSKLRSAFCTSTGNCYYRYFITVDGNRLKSTSWKNAKAIVARDANYMKLDQLEDIRVSPDGRTHNHRFDKDISVLTRVPTPAFALAPIGRPFQVTPSMVWSDDDDVFLRKHYYDMVINGRAGDRFKIDWSAPVTTGFDQDEDGYDVAYPKNASIFDKAGSITVTLRKDGDHVLRFSQSGVQFAESGGGGMLADFNGRAPRGLIPITMTVSRLN